MLSGLLCAALWRSREWAVPKQTWEEKEKSALRAGVLLVEHLVREVAPFLLYQRGGACCHFCRRSGEEGKRGCYCLTCCRKASELWNVSIWMLSCRKRKAEFLTWFPPVWRRQGTRQPHPITIACSPKILQVEHDVRWWCSSNSKNPQHQEVKVKNHLNTSFRKTTIAASGAPRAAIQSWGKAACPSAGDEGESWQQERDSMPRLLLDEVNPPSGVGARRRPTGRSVVEPEHQRSRSPLHQKVLHLVFLVKGAPHFQRSEVIIDSPRFLWFWNK